MGLLQIWSAKTMTILGLAACMWGVVGQVDETTDSETFQSCLVNQFNDSSTNKCFDCAQTCTEALCFTNNTIDQCIDCPSGYTFDLQTRKCIDEASCETQDPGFTLAGFGLSYTLGYSSIYEYSASLWRIFKSTAISTCRLNLLYVNPMSTAYLELGTLEYPFKRLADAQHEVFNNFYLKNDSGVWKEQQVVIALETSGPVFLSDLFIVDSTNVTVTTYDSRTGLIDLISNYSGASEMPTRGTLVTSNNALQDVVEVGFKVVSGPSYNFTERINLDSLNNNQRAELTMNMNILGSYKYPFFNFFNGTLNIQNLQFEDGNSLTITTDYVIYAYNEALYEALTILNCEIRTSIRFLITLSLSEVTFKYCEFDFSQFKFHLIIYGPDSSYCAAMKGFLLIDSCSFSGVSPSSEEFMISNIGAVDIAITNNVFSNCGSKNFMNEGLITISRENICSTQFDRGIVRITDNQFVYSSSDAAYKFNIGIAVSEADIDLNFNLTNNSISKLNNDATFLTFYSKTETSINVNLDIGFSVEESTLVSSSYYFFEVTSFDSGTMAFQSLNVSHSQINNLLAFNAPSASLIFNNLSLSNNYDLKRVFYKQSVLQIESVSTLHFNNFSFQNSSLSLAQLVQVNTVTEMVVDSLTVRNNSVYKKDLFGINSVSRFSMTNILMSQTNVTNKNKVHLLQISNLNCWQYSQCLLVANLTAQNANQMPFLSLLQVSSEGAVALKNESNEYLVELQNLTFSLNSVASDHIFNLGATQAANIHFLLKGLSFVSNTLASYGILYLGCYSQNFQLIDVTFNNNTGTLIETKPKAIASTSEAYYLQIISQNIQITNNKQQSKPLILLQQYTNMKVLGPLDSYSQSLLPSSVLSNVALSNQGLISIYRSNCFLSFANATIESNSALNGGVFSIRFSGAVTCTGCLISNNSAVIGGLAHISSDGYIELSECLISGNFALDTQLIYFIANTQSTSSITRSQILANKQFGSLLERQAYFKLIISEAFPNLVDFSFLNRLESSGDSDDTTIQIMRSNLQIDSTTVERHSFFIQSVIESKITITASHFSNAAASGYLIKCLQSAITISGCTFKNFVNVDPSSSFFLLYSSINSHLDISDSSFESLDFPLLSQHSSVLSLSHTNVTKIRYGDSAVFETRLSTIMFSSCMFADILTSTATSIFNILEGNELTVTDSNISNFNSQLFYLKKSALTIASSSISSLLASSQTFQNSICIFSMASRLLIKDSFISDMNSQQHGGAVYAFQSYVDRKVTDMDVTITNTVFSNCSSSQGGAIYVENSNTYIRTSTFANNQAQYGGAVYFKCCETCKNNDAYKCHYEFSNSNCTNNSASFQGGCHLTNLYQVALYSSSLYALNSAPYGPNYSAYAFGASLVEFSDDGVLSNKSTNVNAVSGQQIESSFQIALFDFYGQVINDENSAICKIVDNGPTSASLGDSKINLTITQQDQAISNGGVFNFTTTLFKSSPGYVGLVNMTTATIDSSKYSNVTGSTFKNYQFTVDLRNCIKGEAIKESICSPCGAGTYSLVENSAQCFSCPDHASCSGYEILPDYGYWRSSNESTDIAKCFFADACPGFGVQVCNSEFGYTGVLCHECAYNASDSSQRFTRQKDHQCARCPEKAENIRTYTLIFLAGQVYIGFLTYSYYKNLVLEKENTVVLKVFTTYTQIISMISQFDLNWPSSISVLFTGMGAPAQASSALYSIDCLLKDFNVTGPEQTIFVSLLITALQPFLQFFLAMIVYIVCWLCKMKQIKVKMLVTVTVIYYLAYPQIVKSTFNLFRCSDSIDGVSYLVMNTNIQCFGSTHIKLILFLAIPIMVVWIFGIPILVLATLYKKRKNLDNVDNLRTFGFWYLGLKRDRYYWELLLEYKKLMMITITVDVMGLGSDYQAFIVLLLLYGYFLLSSNLQPYKVAYINTVSFYSEFAQMATFAYVMVYLKESDNALMDNLVLVLIIFANGLFFCQFGFYYGRFYYLMLKEKYDAFKKKMQKKPEDQDNEFEKVTEGSEDNQIKSRKATKPRRRAPSAAKLYKSSKMIGSQSRRRESYQSERSPSGKSDGDHSNLSPQVSLHEQRSHSPTFSRALSPESAEYRKQLKIIQIKANKQRRQQLKKKMQGQDGPIGIKIEDYIREEKRRIKREQRVEEAKEERQDLQGEREETKEEQRIPLKDFNLKTDSKGHLLNAEVLDQIKKLY